MSCAAASIEAFPFGPGTFDLVILGELLEHVAYPENLLERTAGLLKPGGLLLATTPNGERVHTGLPTLSQVADRKELESRQFQPDADGHLFLLSRRELVQAAEHAHLRVLEHQVFGTPWITGRLMARHVVGRLPVGIRWKLDRMTVRVPVLKTRLADGQLLVAQVPEPAEKAA